MLPIMTGQNVDIYRSRFLHKLRSFESVLGLHEVFSVVNCHCASKQVDDVVWHQRKRFSCCCFLDVRCEIVHDYLELE